jgi:peptide subunit release factor 1 (eRF1)
MLTEKNLRELIRYRPDEPVLSVYLNVDPKEGSADVYKLNLRQQLKDFEKTAPDDVEAMISFIEHQYDWSGRSLALFSSSKDNFFRHFSFSTPIRSRTRRMMKPYVKPIADILDNYGHYGIAIVDKQGSRLFHFHLGELREFEGTSGETVRHTKLGGGSQAPGRRGGTAGQTRYADEVAERNLKESARLAAKFFKDNQVRRILVGGTEATVSFFLSQLPKASQSLILGTFPMEMSAGTAQILDKVVEVAQRAEQEKERNLIDAVVTAAAKGQEGVVGLDQTLAAVHAGRVQTLLVSEGFRSAGYRCEGCEYLSSYAPEQCPFCSNEFVEIQDAVELAIRRVFADGGDVEIIHENLKLENAGKIGGLLRY